MEYRYVKQKWMNKLELIDLGKSSLALTLAFVILYYGNIPLIHLIPATFLTITAGFVLHEMAHKYFAIKYGAQARFVSNDKMLIFAIIGAFLGFIFAAPGAVMIRGQLTKNKFGIIALAGPLTNFVLGILFWFLTPFYPPLILGAVVNTWLGAFNLIPIPPFDGQKILSWNKIVYGVIVVIAFVLLFTLVF